MNKKNDNGARAGLTEKENRKKTSRPPAPPFAPLSSSRQQVTPQGSADPTDIPAANGTGNAASVPAHAACAAPVPRPDV